MQGAYNLIRFGSGSSGPLLLDGSGFWARASAASGLAGPSVRTNAALPAKNRSLVPIEPPFRSASGPFRGLFCGSLEKRSDPAGVFAGESLASARKAFDLPERGGLGARSGVPNSKKRPRSAEKTSRRSAPARACGRAACGWAACKCRGRQSGCVEATIEVVVRPWSRL